MSHQSLTGLTGREVMASALQAVGWTVTSPGSYLHAARPIALGRREELVIAFAAETPDIDILLAAVPALPPVRILISDADLPLSPTVEAKARQHQFSIYSLRDAVASVLGADEYLRLLPDYLQQHMTSDLVPLRHYVSLDTVFAPMPQKRTKVHLRALDAELEARIRVVGSATVVLGPSGSGKTTSALETIRRLCSSPDSNIFPILVLGRIVNRQLTRDPLHAVWQDVLPGALGKPDDLFRALSNVFHVVLVIDGADELQTFAGYHGLSDVLGTISSRVPYAQSCLITTRVESFANFKQEVQLLARAIEGFQDDTLLYAPGPLKYQQAFQILDSQLPGPGKAAVVFSALERMDRRFVEHPMLLQTVIELLDKENPEASFPAAASARPSAQLAAMIESCVGTWLQLQKAEKGRSLADTASKEQYLQYLATSAFIHGRHEVAREDLERSALAVFKDPNAPYFSELAMDARMSGVVEIDREGKHRFVAGIFRDYFLARSIRAEIERALDTDTELPVLGTTLLSEVGVRPEVVVSCLLHAGWSRELLVERLQLLLRKTRHLRYRKLPPHRFLGANLLRLRVECARVGQKAVIEREDFAGMDFFGFRLGLEAPNERTPDALREVTFRECQFQLCNFSGTDLEGIRFVRGRLERSNWSHARAHAQLWDRQDAPALDDSIGWEACERYPSDVQVRYGTFPSLATMDKYSRVAAGTSLLALPPFDSTLGEGCGADSLDPTPVRLDPFFVDVCAVSNADFQTFVRANPKWQAEDGRKLIGNPYYLFFWSADTPIDEREKSKDKFDGRPVMEKAVTYVGYFAAREFAASVGKRLLTEAEWEATARFREQRWGPKTDTRPNIDLPRPPKEWVLDQDVGQNRYHPDQRLLADLNPCWEETSTPPAGIRVHQPSFYNDPSAPTRRRVFRGYPTPIDGDASAGSGSPTDGTEPTCACWRLTIFEGSVNPDLGFRCAVDWFFVDGSGRSHLSTEAVLQDLLVPADSSQEFSEAAR